MLPSWGLNTQAKEFYKSKKKERKYQLLPKEFYKSKKKERKYQLLPT